MIEGGPDVHVRILAASSVARGAGQGRVGHTKVGIEIHGLLQVLNRLLILAP